MEELKVGDLVYLYSKEEILLKNGKIDETAHDTIMKHYELPAIITSINGCFVRFNNEKSGWYLSWFYKNKREQECIGL